MRKFFGREQQLEKCLEFWGARAVRTSTRLFTKANLIRRSRRTDSSIMSFLQTGFCAGRTLNFSTGARIYHPFGEGDPC